MKIQANFYYCCSIGIIFLGASLCLENSMKYIERKEDGVRPLNPGDVALIFYSRVKNSGPTKKLVRLEKKRCCLFVLDNSTECNSMRLHGGLSAILHPGTSHNLTMFFVNPYLFGRKGECIFNILSKDVINSSKSQHQLVTSSPDFNISFNTELSKPSLIRHLLFLDMVDQDLGSDDVVVCDSLDQDPSANCQPVNCAIKYSGYRSLFNDSTKVCVTTPKCTGKQIISPVTGECRDVFPQSMIHRSITSDMTSAGSGEGIELELQEADKQSKSVPNKLARSNRASDLKGKALNKRPKKRPSLSNGNPMLALLAPKVTCVHGAIEGIGCKCDEGWISKPFQQGLGPGVSSFQMCDVLTSNGELMLNATRNKTSFKVLVIFLLAVFLVLVIIGLSVYNFRRKRKGYKKLDTEYTEPQEPPDSVISEVTNRREQKSAHSMIPQIVSSEDKEDTNAGIDDTNTGIEGTNTGKEDPNTGTDDTNTGKEDTNKGTEDTNKGTEDANKGTEILNESQYRPFLFDFQSTVLRPEKVIPSRQRSVNNGNMNLQRSIEGTEGVRSQLRKEELEKFLQEQVYNVASRRRSLCGINSEGVQRVAKPNTTAGKSHSLPAMAFETTQGGFKSTWATLSPSASTNAGCEKGLIAGSTFGSKRSSTTSFDEKQERREALSFLSKISGNLDVQSRHTSDTSATSIWSTTASENVFIPDKPTIYSGQTSLEDITFWTEELSTIPEISEPYSSESRNESEVQLSKKESKKAHTTVADRIIESATKLGFQGSRTPSNSNSLDFLESELFPSKELLTLTKSSSNSCISSKSNLWDTKNENREASSTQMASSSRMHWVSDIVNQNLNEGTRKTESYNERTQDEQLDPYLIKSTLKKFLAASKAKSADSLNILRKTP